ncbi:MAG TPA: TorF family putative porin [Steroidobacteraceae bacterium]|nr:TorF family putative porin [Steroidobacteraceae bacterium]
MKRPTLLLIALVSVPLAHAQSATVITGSLGGTSDFVFRGLSLTRGKPAAQASIDVEFPQEFYVGAFAATCDPNRGPSPPFEIDFWAGRYWRVSEDFSADLRLSQYTYPDDPRRVSYNRTEITGTLGFRNRLYLATIYSPNTKAVASSPGYEEGDAWALELSGRQPLNERFALSAGFGHYALNDIYHDSYNYWNVTLSATLKPFELQLAYLGVDDDAARHFAQDAVGDRVAFTALWRFSNQ